MKKAPLKQGQFEAAEYLEALKQLRLRYRDFIQDNKDLLPDLAQLQSRLEEAELINSEFNILESKNAFRRILTRLEEIAEDKQRFYDESPQASVQGRISESLKDFDIKRDFEKSLEMLL